MSVKPWFLHCAKCFNAIDEYSQLHACGHLVCRNCAKSGQCAHCSVQNTSILCGDKATLERNGLSEYFSDPAKSLPKYVEADKFWKQNVNSYCEHMQEELVKKDKLLNTATQENRELKSEVERSRAEIAKLTADRKSGPGDILRSRDAARGAAQGNMPSMRQFGQPTIPAQQGAGGTQQTTTKRMLVGDDRRSVSPASAMRGQPGMNVVSPAPQGRVGAAQVGVRPQTTPTCATPHETRTVEIGPDGKKRIVIRRMQPASKSVPRPNTASMVSSSVNTTPSLTAKQDKEKIFTSKVTQPGSFQPMKPQGTAPTSAGSLGGLRAPSQPPVQTRPVLAKTLPAPSGQAPFKTMSSAGSSLKPMPTSVQKRPLEDTVQGVKQFRPENAGNTTLPPPSSAESAKSYSFTSTKPKPLTEGLKPLSELKVPSFMSKPPGQADSSTAAPAPPSAGTGRAPTFDSSFTPGVIERRPLFG